MCPSKAGGLANIAYSNPTLTEVTFSNNPAKFGAGVANQNSRPTLQNVSFLRNVAYSADLGSGGGVHNENNRNTTLINVVSFGNSAYRGDGMYNTGSSSPILTDTTFSRNTVTLQGGAMASFVNSNPTLVNSILWGICGAMELRRGPRFIP